MNRTKGEGEHEEICCRCGVGRLHGRLRSGPGPGEGSPDHRRFWTAGRAFLRPAEKGRGRRRQGARHRISIFHHPGLQQRAGRSGPARPAGGGAPPRRSHRVGLLSRFHGPANQEGGRLRHPGHHHGRRFRIPGARSAAWPTSATTPKRSAFRPARSKRRPAPNTACASITLPATRRSSRCATATSKR